MTQEDFEYLILNMTKSKRPVKDAICKCCTILSNTINLYFIQHCIFHKLTPLVQ